MATLLTIVLSSVVAVSQWVFMLDELWDGRMESLKVDDKHYKRRRLKTYSNQTGTDQEFVI